LIGILNWKLADTSDRNTFNSLFEFEWTTYWQIDTNII
jgi:hypothetical protein